MDDKYCLDTNVLIQAWQKYYSPDFCSDYWEVLNELGKKGRVFLPEVVLDELKKGEDELFDWVKSSDIQVRKISEPVANSLRLIYSVDPSHIHLVDNTKARSLADPWVIAHAIYENAVVVTKEERITAPNSKRIKIPNVCDNMNVRWVNDFQFIQEIGLRFSCSLP